MGIALAAVLYPIVNQTLWRELDERPALEWKSFGILVGLIAIINLLVLADSPIILYPMAYLSALGTLSLLVFVFAILWIMIMRQDNTFVHAHQLWFPLLSGLTLALLMLLSFDLLLQFTGTWSGFPGCRDKLPSLRGVSLPKQSPHNWRLLVGKNILLAMTTIKRRKNGTITRCFFRIRPFSQRRT